MAYGLTSSGFVIKPYQTIQQELQAAMQAIFGNDLDVSDQSVAGQWINEMAQKEYQLWELAQAVYASWSPDTASGDALDDACARVNILRLPATPTKVTVLLYGSAGTVVSLGHLVQQAITLLQFSLDASVTIQQANAGDAIITVGTVADLTAYTITINGTSYTYTSGVSATAQSIITGLTAALGTITGLTITNPSVTSIKIFTSDGITPYNLIVTANLTVGSLASPGAYTATTNGAYSVPLETVTIIVNAVGGLTSVINYIQGTIGRDLETDDVLRVRRRIAVTGQGRATDIAIQSYLQQQVTGVSAVTVISNRTDFTDGVGRPPHSFEAIVTGGTDADVANGIWACMPAGIQTYGNTYVQILDSNGNLQDIYFSRPVNVYIWLQITLTYYNEEIFPVGGNTQVKSNIVAYSLGEYKPGTDVIWQRLLSPIYLVAGIGSATILLATSATPGGPPGPYTTANISIASNEIAIFDVSRISVAP